MFLSYPVPVPSCRPVISHWSLLRYKRPQPAGEHGKFLALSSPKNTYPALQCNCCEAAPSILLFFMHLAPHPPAAQPNRAAGSVPHTIVGPLANHECPARANKDSRLVMSFFLAIAVPCLSVLFYNIVRHRWKLSQSPSPGLGKHKLAARSLQHVELFLGLHKDLPVLRDALPQHRILIEPAVTYRLHLELHLFS